MNTLSRAMTARFFPNLDSYNAFREHWSVLINSERKHELTAAHHLLYLALVGKDWRKAFTALTNRRKLENGAFWSWGLFRALFTLHSSFSEQDLLAPFDGLVTSQILRELRSVLPLIHPSDFQPDKFVNRRFPFESYKEQGTTLTVSTLKESSHD